jgi:ClpP class serine protease
MQNKNWYYMHNDLQAGLLNSMAGEALAVTPGYWQSTLSELALLSTTGLTGADINARKAEGRPRLLAADGSGGNTANLNSSSSTPPRSIAHLTLSGLMLAGDFLFYRGVNHLTAALLAAEQNPNIAGVLLEVNSGGGQATAGEMLKSTLASMSKPVVVLTHYMGSAAVLGTLPAAAIVASSQGVQVGSIGTYVQISTAQLNNEKRNYETIYAKQSTNKNREHRAAGDGNFKPYQELVEKFNTMFLLSVRKYRKLSGDVTGTLSGNMFFADDAKKRGLVDHVGTFTDAVKILNQEIYRREASKMAPPRPKASTKPTPPATPNAARPWLNSAANQRTAARLAGIDYDASKLLEAPAGKPAAKQSETAAKTLPTTLANVDRSKPYSFKQIFKS